MTNHIVTPTPRCAFYELDIHGELMSCRNGAHLRKCLHWSCQRSFKCRLSYCIPLRYVCNGVVDCPEGDDEEGCKADSPCPTSLRCRRGACIHQTEVCDGIVHCPLGDDERVCLGSCPEGCICYGTAVYCTGVNGTSDALKVTYSPTYLYVRGGYAMPAAWLLSPVKLSNEVRILDARSNQISIFAGKNQNKQKSQCT